MDIFWAYWIVWIYLRISLTPHNWILCMIIFFTTSSRPIHLAISCIDFPCFASWLKWQRIQVIWKYCLWNLRGLYIIKFVAVDLFQGYTDEPLSKVLTAVEEGQVVSLDRYIYYIIYYYIIHLLFTINYWAAIFLWPINFILLVIHILRNFESYENCDVIFETLGKMPAAFAPPPKLIRTLTSLLGTYQQWEELSRK